MWYFYYKMIKELPKGPHMKKQNMVLTWFLMGVLSVLISGVMSFIVGVYYLDHTFIGYSYHGAFIYYPAFSTLTLLGIVILRIRNLRGLTLRSLLICATLSSATYSLCSFIVIKLYISYMDNLPHRSVDNMNELIGRNPGYHYIIIIAIFLFITMLLLGRIFKKLGRPE